MRHQALVLLARVLDVGTAFVFIMLTIWIGGTAVYGEIAYYAAFFIPVQAFAYAKYIEAIRFADFKSNAFRKQLIFSLVVFVTGGSTIAVGLGLSHSNTLLIVVIFVQKLVEIFDDISKAYRFAVDRLRSQIVQSSLKLGVIICLLGVFAIFDPKQSNEVYATSFIFVLACAQFVSAASVSGPLIRSAFRRSILIAALRPVSIYRSFTAGTINLTCSLTATLPRIFLGVFASLSDVAVFTVCYQIAATVVNLVVLNLLSAIGKFHLMFLAWFSRATVFLIALTVISLIVLPRNSGSPSVVQLGSWSLLMASAVSFRTMAVGIAFKKGQIRWMLFSLLVALSVSSIAVLTGFALEFTNAVDAAFLFVLFGCVGASFIYGARRTSV